MYPIAKNNGGKLEKFEQFKMEKVKIKPRDRDRYGRQ